ncbi:MAG: class I SAM-dependent methyltransferase [Burkholderiales bacterium]|nr:class I SAM-dependent methyltransferase [Burkholderiales bacterium]
MQRIPEPELMTDPAQAQAYAEADFSAPHDAFVVHFAARFPDFKAGRVLDLGCGAADVTLRFARAYPDAEIVGIDGAEAMLTLGYAAITRVHCADRITLHCMCLPDSSVAHQAFDAVISNSLLHHLSAPDVLWQTIQHAAKPGAPVCVMDLLRPHSREEATRLLALHAAGAPEILRRDFFNSLLAAYEIEEVRAQLRAAALPQLQVKPVSDRHMLIFGRC